MVLLKLMSSSIAEQSCGAVQAADVYAYGVLLCELFTHRPVWQGLRHPQIIHAIAVQKKHPELPASTPAPYKVRLSLCPKCLPCSRVDPVLMMQWSENAPLSITDMFRVPSGIGECLYGG